MKKVAIGFVVALSLLGVVGPAISQTADPLGLIRFGALLPYQGGGQSTGELSFLEVLAPVGNVFDLHGFFFDSKGNRVGFTVGLPLTVNDAVLFRIDNLVPSVTRGLLAMTSVDATGFNPVPLSNPIYARVLWLNPAQNFARVLEPISIQNAESPDASQVWNPLRTAAAFFAPLESWTAQSTLVLICPNQNIITAAFSSPPFPELVPHPVASGPTPLHIRVYSTDEVFLRDLHTTCDAFSTIPLKSLNSIYSDATQAPFGTYTEIEGGTNAVPFSFTGYLATRTGGRGEFFGRLRSGNMSSIQGTLTPGVR